MRKTEFPESFKLSVKAEKQSTQQVVERFVIAGIVIFWTCLITIVAIIAS